MDTEKLFRIIKDVLQDEKSINVISYINQIRAGIAQNNPDGFTTARTQLNKLDETIKETSTSYSFSKTEQEILENLGDTGFFGSNLILNLNSYLELQGYETVAKIDQYKNERTIFIQKIERLVNSFTELGVEEYRPEDPEIGIILPITQGDAETVYRKIHEFNLLIKTVQELVGSEERKVKIDRVSNGTLEFFTSQPVAVVVVVTTILANISQIWDKIATLRKKKTDTDSDPVISDSAKDEIKKIIDKDINAIKKEIEEKLPQAIVDKYANKDLKEERKNEIRNHIRAKAKLIFSWFEIGIEVDIVPVRVLNETSTPEQKEEIKNVISEIRTTNHLLQQVYNLPLEIKRLPFKLEKEKANTEEVENEESVEGITEETK
jgi:hypothetical protein